MTQAERIHKMEVILGKSEALTKNLVKALGEFEAYEKEYNDLVNYYYAEEWMKDKEDFESGAVTNVKSAGVLSEDAIWDLMSENHELSIQLLELATRLLKK